MNNQLKYLNENQLKAVTSTSKRILVSAGAGSGKTRVLTTRIHYLINNNVPEMEIAAFTFTNKAAREMKWRLKAMLKRDPEVIISTFHSYCYSIIIEPYNYPKLGFYKKPDVILETDKFNLIREILDKYNKDYSNIQFASAISKIKNKVDIKNINNIDLALLNTIYHEYQERLKASNLIDFDDMIPLYIKLLKEDEYFLESQQFTHVLCDECQDTNAIQYELIELLSQKNGNIVMIGDSDQLIYSFRSSDIEIIKSFESSCNEVIILNQNYRSTDKILEASNKLINNNTNRLKKELIPNNMSNFKIKFNEYLTVSEEADEVVKKIEELLKINPNLKKSDIAILYRNNNQSFILEKVLKNKDIDYSLYGGKAFFDYVEIRSIINTYRLLLNPKNEIAFEQIYNKPSPILEVKDYLQFQKDYKNQNLDIIEFSSTYNDLPKLQQLGQTLKQLKEDLYQLDNNLFFNKLLKHLKYTKYLNEEKNPKPQYIRIMALKEMISELNVDDIDNSFNQILLDNQSTPAINSIQLLTIHKAKGLEFEVVFVVGLNEGIIPSYNAVGLNLEEERRLCYVALTRAKKQLYVSCAAVHFINGKTTKFKPSRFLIESDIINDESNKFFKGYWYNK